MGRLPNLGYKLTRICKDANCQLPECKSPLWHQKIVHNSVTGPPGVLTPEVIDGRPISGYKIEALKVMAEVLKFDYEIRITPTIGKVYSNLTFGPGALRDVSMKLRLICVIS